MTSARLDRPSTAEATRARLLIAGLLLLAAGAAGIVLTHGSVAAVIFLAGVALLAVARPGMMLIAVIVLFPIHPLVMRVANIDLGLGGAALVLTSAWKEVALGVIVVLAIVRLARNPRTNAATRRFHPFDLLALALVVLIAGTLVAQPTLIAINAARLLLFPVGVYVAVRLGMLDDRPYLRSTVIAAGLVGAFGIIQGWLLGWGFVEAYWGIPGQSIPYTFTAQYLDGPRSAGTLSSPVEFGTYLAMLIAVTTATIVARADQRRVALLVLPILVVAVALTFSRSAIVAAAIGGTFVLVAAAVRGQLTRPVVAMILVVAIPAVAVSGVVYASRGGVDLIRSTMITLTGEGNPPAPGSSPAPGTANRPTAPPVEGSTVDHITSLQDGVRLVTIHAFGVGLGNVGSRSVPGSEERPAYFAESWYLTMGLTLGWLGLLWALLWTVSLAALAIGKLRRMDTVIPLSLLGTVVTVVFVGLLLPTLVEPQVAVLPWALAGLLVVGDRFVKDARAKGSDFPGP